MIPLVYIGFDRRERQAYDVARRSILRTASGPVSVLPLILGSLKMLTRPVERKDGKLWCPISQAPMATEFAISRFAIPSLWDTGWALFMDCDMVVNRDIYSLFALADPKYAVMVVKHEQESGPTVKMDGQTQTFYARKNWSSLALYNLEHPSNRRLTEEKLNTWPGRLLHAFGWLDDGEIGELPITWNYLVGVTRRPIIDPALVHYTLGIPSMAGYENCEYADLWRSHLK